MTPITSINDFESAYHKEEKEILVLTSDDSGGAVKDQGDILWTASRYFLAYIDNNSNELKCGDGRVVWPLTDEEIKDRDSWQSRFKDGCIYRLKVRELIDKTVPEGMIASAFNRFFVVEVLEEDVQNDDLLAILGEYRKPVTFVDEVLGEFVLNKNLGFFEGEILWLGTSIPAYLEVDADDEGTWTKAANVLRTLFEQQERRDSEYRLFAAKKLVGLANQWNREDDEKSANPSSIVKSILSLFFAKISKQDFMDRMSIESVSVASDGEFTVCYKDGDLFWGHAIVVSGHVSNGLKSAEIAG